MSEEAFEIEPVKKRSLAPRIIFGIVSILLGVAFILLRNVALSVIGYVVGGMSLAAGVVTIIAFLASHKNKLIISLISGIIEALFGILFLIKPNILADIAIYLFAAVVFISGMVMLYTATQDKKFGIINWKVTLVFGIVLALLGALMLLFIKQDRVFIAVLIGIELIVDGVLDVIAVAFR